MKKPELLAALDHFDEELLFYTTVPRNNVLHNWTYFLELDRSSDEFIQKNSKVLEETYLYEDAIVTEIDSHFIKTAPGLPYENSTGWYDITTKSSLPIKPYYSSLSDPGYLAPFLTIMSSLNDIIMKHTVTETYGILYSGPLPSTQINKLIQLYDFIDVKWFLVDPNLKRSDTEEEVVTVKDNPKVKIVRGQLITSVNIDINEHFEGVNQRIYIDNVNFGKIRDVDREKLIKEMKADPKIKQGTDAYTYRMKKINEKLYNDLFQRRRADSKTTIQYLGFEHNLVRLRFGYNIETKTPLSWLPAKLRLIPYNDHGSGEVYAYVQKVDMNSNKTYDVEKFDGFMNYFNKFWRKRIYGKYEDLDIPGLCTCYDCSYFKKTVADLYTISEGNVCITKNIWPSYAKSPYYPKYDDCTRFSYFLINDIINSFNIDNNEKNLFEKTLVQQLGDNNGNISAYHGGDNASKLKWLTKHINLFKFNYNYVLGQSTDLIVNEDTVSYDVPIDDKADVVVNNDDGFNESVEDVENDFVENDFVEDDIVENDFAEDDFVENDFVEDDVVEDMVGENAEGQAEEPTEAQSEEQVDDFDVNGYNTDNVQVPYDENIDFNDFNGEEFDIVDEDLDDNGVVKRY